MNKKCSCPFIYIYVRKSVLFLVLLSKKLIQCFLEKNSNPRTRRMRMSFYLLQKPHIFFICFFLESYTFYMLKVHSSNYIRRLNKHSTHSCSIPSYVLYKIMKKKWKKKQRKWAYKSNDHYYRTNMKFTYLIYMLFFYFIFKSYNYWSN